MRLARVLPQVLCQPPSLDKLQTLFHVAILLLTGVDLRPARVTMLECIAIVHWMRAPKSPDEIGKALDSASGIDFTRIIAEEKSRTCWFVAFFDKMMGAWINEGCKLSHMSLLTLPLPCHEAVWLSQSDTALSPSLKLSQVLTVDVNRLFSMPTLAAFLDTTTWPVESTGNVFLGRLAFTTVLSVHCFGKVLEYRLHPSNDLYDSIMFDMSTWLARFHNILGVPPPPTPRSLDFRDDIIARTPWAFSLFIQYHCMWGLWHAPLPGSRNFNINEVLSDSNDTAPFIQAWVASPAFVICLDHVRVAIAAIDEFLIIHGEQKLQELLFAGGGFSLGMSVIPLIIAAKEALLNYRTSVRSANGEHSVMPQAEVLLQFIRQTQAQIATAAKVLRMISQTQGRSSMDRGKAAARLIERLLDSVINPSSDPESSRLVDWVAGESTGIIWRMYEVSTGTPPHSLVDAAAKLDGTALDDTSNAESVVGALSTKFQDLTIFNAEGIVDNSLDF
ncbi:hypothetical protein HDU93_005945, partial [Gonapodya sp. JEL0774]